MSRMRRPLKTLQAKTCSAQQLRAYGEGAGEGGGGGGGGGGGEWQWRVAVAAAVVEVVVRAGGGAEDNRLLTSHSTWSMYRAAQWTPKMQRSARHLAHCWKGDSASPHPAGEWWTAAIRELLLVRACAGMRLSGRA